jgi:hypothetical protein
LQALPPGDATQDILAPRWIGSGEPCRVACACVEAMKAVKQIQATLRSCTARDGVEAAVLEHRGAQGAIRREGRQYSILYQTKLMSLTLYF